MGDRKVLYLLSFPKPRLKLAEVEGKFFSGAQSILLHVQRLQPGHSLSQNKSWE